MIDMSMLPNRNSPPRFNGLRESNQAVGRLTIGKEVSLSNHIVHAYDRDLKALEHCIAEMGGIAEKMLVDAIDALVDLDFDLANRVISADPRLDALQREVERSAILTIARRQPMAVDLRECVAAMRIAGDLERVGDMTKNVAKRTAEMVTEARVPHALLGLKSMADLAALQLKDVLDAFAQRDVERARSVWFNDYELDALEYSVFRDLLTFMIEDPKSITFCTHLLFCSKNIERIGDHATNIAETIVYLVTGEPMPIDRPKTNSAIALVGN